MNRRPTSFSNRVLRIAEAGLGLEARKLESTPPAITEEKMFRTLTLIAAAAAICTFQPSPAYARDLVFQAHAKSGEPTRVRRFFRAAAAGPSPSTVRSPSNSSSKSSAG